MIATITADMTWLKMLRRTSTIHDMGIEEDVQGTVGYDNNKIFFKPGD